MFLLKGYRVLTTSVLSAPHMLSNRAENVLTTAISRGNICRHGRTHWITLHSSLSVIQKEKKKNTSCRALVREYKFSLDLQWLNKYMLLNIRNQDMASQQLNQDNLRQQTREGSSILLKNVNCCMMALSRCPTSHAPLRKKKGRCKLRRSATYWGAACHKQDSQTGSQSGTYSTF